MSLNQHLTTITNIVNSFSECPKLEHLDLMTAYYYGLTSSQTDPDTCQKIFSKIESLLQLRVGLKFLDRLVALSGSGSLTPKSKQEAIETNSILPRLEAVNRVLGKDNVMPLLEPFSDRLGSFSFHEDFLTYDREARSAVIGALIQIKSPTKPDRLNSTMATPNTLKTLYTPGSVGKTFLSLDLRQANWSALRDWNPNLPSWEDFLASHLPDGPLKPLFIASKNFRQVTLGVALKNNSIKFVEARQVSLTRHAAKPIQTKLGKPFCQSNDEVIFNWDLSQDPATFDSWAIKAVSPRFRLTRFTILRRDDDGCFTIQYHDLSPSRDYTLLRCSTPELVENRLKST